MKNIARIGDSISHGGSIVSGSPNTYCNGNRVARIGDAVVCAIHGSQTITGSSPNVSVNSPKLARIGDAISCGAVISSGSPNVFDRH